MTIKTIDDDDIDSIIEKFETTDVQILFDDNGKSWWRPIDLAKALNYIEPKNSADKILKRNADHFKDEIEDFPTRHGVSSEKRLSEVGMYFFIMCSQQPKAKDFKLWAAKKLKEHRSPSDPLQQGLMICKQLVKSYEYQIESERKIKENRNRIEFIEERQQELTLELYNISKSQQRELQNKVKEAVEIVKPLYTDLSDRKLYSVFYGFLKDWFEVPRYSEIPKERFPEALTVLSSIETLILTEKINLEQYITIEQLRKKIRILDISQN